MTIEFDKQVEFILNELIDKVANEFNISKESNLLKDNESFESKNSNDENAILKIKIIPSKRKSKRRRRNINYYLSEDEIDSNSNGTTSSKNKRRKSILTEKILDDNKKNNLKQLDIKKMFDDFKLKKERDELEVIFCGYK